jgi:hypothetical protein
MVYATNGTVQMIYRDGVEVKRRTARGNYIGTGDFSIGSGPFGAGFNGPLDEYRVSTVAVSSNWVWACWLNQASNSVFNCYGRLVDHGMLLMVR